MRVRHRYRRQPAITRGYANARPTCAGPVRPRRPPGTRPVVHGYRPAGKVRRMSLIRACRRTCGLGLVAVCCAVAGSADPARSAGTWQVTDRLDGGRIGCPRALDDHGSFSWAVAGLPRPSVRVRLFGSPAAVTLSGVGQGGCVQGAAAGNVSLSVWREAAGAIVAQGTVDGASEPALRIARASTRTLVDPQVGVSADAGAVVAWSEEPTPDRFRTRLVLRPPGGRFGAPISVGSTWTARTDVSEDGAGGFVAASRPQAAVASDGTFAVVWLELVRQDRELDEDHLWRIRYGVGTISDGLTMTGDVSSRAHFPDHDLDVADDGSMVVAVAGSAHVVVWSGSTRAGLLDRERMSATSPSGLQADVREHGTAVVGFIADGNDTSDANLEFLVAERRSTAAAFSGPRVLPALRSALSDLTAPPPAVALGPDGTFLVTWTGPAGGGTRPVTKAMVVESEGPSGTPTTLTAPCRAAASATADGITPLAKPFFDREHRPAVLLLDTQRALDAEPDPDVALASALDRQQALSIARLLAAVPPVADTTPPELSLRIPPGQVLAEEPARPLRVLASCDEQCDLRVSATAPRDLRDAFLSDDRVMDAPATRRSRLALPVFSRYEAIPATARAVVTVTARACDAAGNITKLVRRTRVRLGAGREPMVRPGAR